MSDRILKFLPFRVFAKRRERPLSADNAVIGHPWKRDLPDEFCGGNRFWQGNNR